MNKLCIVEESRPQNNSGVAAGKLRRRECTWPFVLIHTLLPVFLHGPRGHKVISVSQECMNESLRFYLKRSMMARAFSNWSRARGQEDN